jgi:Polyketide synthase dehydratase N-terminal domain
VGRPGPDDTLLVEVQLASKLQPNPGMPVQERVHFRARVVLARAPLASETVAFQPPADVNVDDRAIYRVYFHGPAYRVLEGVRLDGDHAVGVLRRDLPPNAEDAEAAELVLPRLVELCFQTAGIIDIADRDLLGLPAQLAALRVYRAPAPGARLFAEVRRGEGDGGFDARVLDADGNVHVALSGYRTVALARPNARAELLGTSVQEGVVASSTGR